MNTEIVEKLFLCPICSADMSISEDGRVLHCLGEKRHCWDVASGGYVNFAGSGGGDSKEAVQARRRFLSLGYYQPAADMIANLIDEFAARGDIVDAGCGEGFYGKTLSGKGRSLVGFDLSRPAVNAAAKLKLDKSCFAVAGINALPIKSQSVAVVTNIFAPCFEAEFCRVLKDQGLLIVVGAGPEHLKELKSALYDTVTENTRRADLPSEMTPLAERSLTYDFTLSSTEQIMDLFSMTPYFYRTSREAVERLSSLDSLTVKADFRFYVFAKGNDK